MTMAEALQLLEKGKRYKLRHRIQGVQRYDRKSVLVYLGVKESCDELQFSGRDFARNTRCCGDTSFNPEHLISIERVRDDAPLYVNARWR